MSGRRNNWGKSGFTEPGTEFQTFLFFSHVTGETELREREIIITKASLFSEIPEVKDSKKVKDMGFLGG